MRVFHLSEAQYALSNISLQRIKISRFNDLNDPFELLAGELSDRDFRRAMSSWKNEFHETRGIVCFSKKWVNPVLWSHYADKHRGLCLGFDIPDKYAQVVRYKKTRLPVQFKEGKREQGLKEKYVTDLLCTKFLHWHYEEEIRMFVGLDEGTIEHGLYFLPFSDQLILKEVVVGPLCETPFETIRSLVTHLAPDVVVTKARLAFKNFAVVKDQRF